MAEAIAGYRYDFADPPDSTSAWVEELYGQAVEVKKELEGARDVEQGLKVKVGSLSMQSKDYLTSCQDVSIISCATSVKAFLIPTLRLEDQIPCKRSLRSPNADLETCAAAHCRGLFGGLE